MKKKVALPQLIKIYSFTECQHISFENNYKIYANGKDYKKREFWK